MTLETRTYSLNSSLQEVDPEVAKIIEAETSRQRTHLELIASENIASRAVMEAQGSTLTNKYAEGLPGKRYYGGCAEVDRVEDLAIDRLKKLFGADHANVQPHSGASANIAVFLSCLNPGDTFLGMALDQGGHLTHGSPVNMSGKWFNVQSYGVEADGWIDYEKVRAKAHECKPKLIIAGASAYPRILHFDKFAEIAEEVGARLLVDMAHISGLVAAGLHPSPIPHAQYVTTTTHKTLRGPRGGVIMCKAEFAKAIDSAVFPGSQGGPLMHVIAAKAVAFREALDPSFRLYQERVIENAKALATSCQQGGLEIVSGGTDNHLLLIDLRPCKMTGKEAEILLDTIGLTANKNAIPHDPEKPWITSGLRLGTPACTTRGLQREDFVELGGIISEALFQRDEDSVLASCAKRVKAICDRFPLYEY